MIELSKIKIHEGSQAREQVNQSTVDEYADALLMGAIFPPVIVFFDSSNFWLADGWHRFLAHQKAGKEAIHEEVRPGTQRDAILYSLGANDSHGLRRSGADKRKAVLTMLYDAEWSRWSNEHIAKTCKVSPHTVADVRKSISANAEIGIKNPLKTVRRNGKTYQQNTANIGKPKTAGNIGQPAYDPAEDAAKEQAHLIETLIEENQTLKDAIAVGSLPEPEQTAGEIITGLRAQVKTLEATVAAITVSRDTLQLENAQLKTQCKIQANKLKKFEGVSNGRA